MSENTNKLCAICLETVDNESSNSYTLPECGCEFHVECVVHWFRQGRNTCPTCRNQGQDTDAMARFHKPDLSHIRKFARKNPDHEINNTLSRLKDGEKKKKDLIAKRKELENSSGVFKEIRKGVTCITRKIWKNNWNINKLKNDIIRQYPVVHVIVVTKKTI